MNLLLLCLAVFIIGLTPLFEQQAVIAKPVTTGTEACEVPGETEEFQKYKTEMERRFKRNLPDNIFIPREIVVRFFLAKDGLINEVSLNKSSGVSSVDFACIDAICASSPLSKPPEFTRVLPPARAVDSLPSYFFGSRFYDFTFLKTLEKKTKTNGTSMKVAKFNYLIVPLEVVYRYPGLFTSAELQSKNNVLSISLKEITPMLLEATRSKWVDFYKNNVNPSKETISKWSQEVVNGLPKN